MLTSRTWQALLLAAALFISSGCGGAVARPKPDQEAPTPAAPVVAAPPADDRPIVVALGDSLTAGLGVSREHIWPSRLQDRLDRSSHRYRVVNAGISGDTSAGGRSRLDKLLELKPEIIILELGANDGLRGLPIAPMRANLDDIIERSQRAGVQVLLAGMEVPPNLGPDYSRQFRQVFTDLARHYKVPLIPFILEGVGGKPDLNQSDGIHPTAAGHAVVVETVWQALEPMLK